MDWTGFMEVRGSVAHPLGDGGCAVDNAAHGRQSNFIMISRKLMYTEYSCRFIIFAFKRF
jgi:hypothetical protein